MVRILMALVAVVVIAVGGYFGFEFYTQHRVASEIETAFAQIRAGGGKASHGKVSFDARSRTVRIADIAIESATEPKLTVRVADVTAAGVGQPEAGRFSADSVEASDIQIGISAASATDGTVTYRIPSLVVKDYAGAAGIPAPSVSTSILDAYRSGLEQFAAMSATSVSAPSVAGTLNLGAVMSGEFVYSGIHLQNIKGGKIAAMQVERSNFTVHTQQAGKSDKMSGEIVNIASRDFDSTAFAAILDPQKAGDDRYIRAYGRTTAGPYTVTSALGLRMRVDAIIFDDVAMRPSKLRIPALLATLQAAKTAPPSPAQARDMIEAAASIYEGVRVGTAEIRGLSVETPQGPFKLEAVRLNLEDGKVGEFAVEGLDTRSPNGPIKIGRFALKSLDIANFIRMAASFSNPAQQPSPDQFLQLFQLLAGVELKAVKAPFKNTGRWVNLDSFDLDWGQFVGSIPSKVRLTAKMNTPVDAADPAMNHLKAAGLDTLSIDGDITAEWTETSRGLVLDMPKLELDGLLKASARITLANVPRQVFSANAAQAIGAAAQIEAGALELTVRDSGAVDRAITQFARSQNSDRDAARRTILNSIEADREAIGGTSAEAGAVFAALARFVESPGQTLIVKLTPRARVPALQLFQLLKTDPPSALAQFRIEASTGL